jgi:hypothetical protein
MPRVIEPMAGENIHDTIAQAIADADRYTERVEFTFNGTKVVVKPGDMASAIYARWHKQIAADDAAYRRSPKGRASAARAKKEAAVEKRKEEQRRKKAEQLGLLNFELLPAPFSVCLIDGIGNRKVPDPHPWTKWVESNTDAYGKAALVYAARWMVYMEKEIAKGKSVAEAAEKTQYEATIEDITGAMQGAASSAIAECWIHGDEFMEWRWPNNPDPE